MGKKFTASATQLKPDPRFNSLLASKFVNCLMHDGKKSVAQNVFYDALERIKERFPMLSRSKSLHQAVENVKPSVEVRSKRVGGATYQVPTPVNPKRQQTLAIRWILAAIRGKKGRPMEVRLADEIMSAHKKEGTAMTTRENIHRMAEATRHLLTSPSHAKAS